MLCDACCLGYHNDIFDNIFGGLFGGPFGGRRKPQKADNIIYPLKSVATVCSAVFLAHKDSIKYQFYLWINSCSGFLLARRYASTGISRHRMSVCLCFTVSVCRYCIKTANHRIMQAMPRDSPRTLVFLRQQSLVDDSLLPEIYAENDPPSFRALRF